MSLSIKGQDFFSSLPVSWRSLRAHANPWCRSKLVLPAEEQRRDHPSSDLQALAEVSAGQTGFREELACLHEQRPTARGGLVLMDRKQILSQACCDYELVASTVEPCGQEAPSLPSNLNSREVGKSLRSGPIIALNVASDVLKLAS